MLWFIYVVFFFFKQKTAYEMRISDWSSDVCSSDLCFCHRRGHTLPIRYGRQSALAKPELIAGIVQYHVGAAENEATAVHMEDLAGEIGRASCRERVCQYV